jgi:sterol desaturase/sphingolipid hydroxylase (fatty acid hydroxylase superfamily)
LDISALKEAAKEWLRGNPVLHELAITAKEFAIASVDPITKQLDIYERLALPHMLSALVLAYLCYYFQQPSEKGRWKGFLKFLQFKEVQWHPSARADYRYVFIRYGLEAAIIVPMALSMWLVLVSVNEGLIQLFGERPAVSVTTFMVVMYSLFSLLFIDLARYWAHRLHHMIPVLWEVHKTHHSAEVLVPVTAKRVHPIEVFITHSMTSVTVGVMTAVVLYFCGKGVGYSELIGFNIFMIGAHSLGGNLRHSHVWMSYGKWIEYIVSSPAQYQIHHSIDPKHYNKNYNTYFSLWDWMFGTLYITSHKPEKLTFGIVGEDATQYRTVRALMFLPLKRIWMRIRQGRTLIKPYPKRDYRAPSIEANPIAVG